MSFPAGKYARYKRATAFFLDWLLRARGRGRHTAQRVQLEAFNEVVKEIAADPSCLTPKLLQELPKALAACRYAILLREHVAAFFPEDDEGQTGHQFFLELLQSWHRSLKTVDVAREELAAVELDNVKFENYYEVLQVDEDFFPDEGKFEVEPEAPKTAKVDRERLFEEAFADELRMELLYLFVELDELLEGVCKVYADVKREKRTLVEATVVVKLAMDTASALTAKLQLKYPTLRSAKDMFNIVRNISQKNFRKKIVDLHTDIMKELDNSFDRGKPGIYLPKYVPGTFLIELLGVGTTLDAILSAIPLDMTQKVIFQDGSFGEAYGEDRTPLYVLLPETNKNKVFLLQQMPMLYNLIVEKRIATGSGYETPAPMETFMALMDKFFTTREVTVPVVFSCICWMKSVAALQGCANLGRSISLTFKHSKDLLRNIEAAIANRKAMIAYNKANDLLLRCAAEIKQSISFHHLARANPLFAGLTMLNHHFQYLHIANEVMFATSRFRAFGHLYNALVQEGYLEHIPFFDKVLEVYDQEIFTPSRAAATHGSYYRSYLLSSNLRASAIDAVYRGENFPVGSEAYKKRKAFHLSDVSEIFRLMRLNDKSVLSGGSWKAMLEAVSDACSKELFDMRVLSRDLLKLNEDLMDTFPEMIAVLGQQKYFQEIIAHPRAGESRQQRVNRALEESVMNLLIPLLDAIQPHNSLDLSALPCNMPTTSITLDGLLATEMCKGVAVVIKTRFATPPQICEQKYFTFPSQPDFATQEYGKLLLKEKTESESENSGKVFTKLMKLMSEGDGPLSASDLNYLKSEVKNDPDLLSMAVPNTETPYAELYTLLHQAAAGPAHDAELVEWMVQMGALIGQPLHCRKELSQKELSSPPKFLPNTMAVHSAAIAGYADIVRVLVESDNMVDLNTRTFHTKETLAHLAVKHGHRDVFELVKAFGIDLRSKDCDGRRVCDVTSNHKWSREIAASTANFRKNTLEDVRKREALFRSQDAERRSQLATAQRNEENENTTGSRNAVTSKTAKKKKNKMKGNTIMNDGTTVESIIATAAESTDNSSVEMARIYLRLLHAAGADVDESFESESVSRLESMLRSKETAIFSRLKDPNVPASEKVDDAESARKMIKEMMWLVKSHAEPSSLNSTYRHIRAVIATEASIGIHFMQKFYRVDHAAIVVPELTHVRELCETTIKFADLVVSAAQLSVSVDRDSQARQILDVLEKRLLKTPFPKRDPSAFREVVQTYSRGRDAMGLGRTSNADVFRRLEWYLMNVVESYDLQLTLDGLVGSPFYFECRPATTTTDQQLAVLKHIIDALPIQFGEMKGIAFLGYSDKRIIYGGTSKGDVERVRGIMLEIVNRLEVQLDRHGLQPCKTSLRLDDFVFSSNGIVREG